MDRPQYMLSANFDLTVYEFESSWRNDRVKKAVKYTVTQNPIIFNLAFGDVIGMNEKGILQINDTIASGDRDIVLNTVAASVYEFTAKNPDIYVIFTGSTESRTRLYRRAISLNYGEISKTFNIFGVVKGEDGMLERVAFDPCVNCNAYLVKRK